ncbi:MAG: hypothetical protein NVS3B20_27390 [Polyangiales bacterium]
MIGSSRESTVMLPRQTDATRVTQSITNVEDMTGLLTRSTAGRPWDMNSTSERSLQMRIVWNDRHLVCL